ACVKSILKQKPKRWEERKRDTVVVNTVTSDARKADGGARKIAIGDRHQLAKALADIPEGQESPRISRSRRRDGAYVSVKLTVTVTIASNPIGVYFHCLTASIADCANTPFVDRKTVTSPIVPSA